MNIDPSLQSFMDPYLKIGRATFAKNSDDQELKDTMLLTMSGMGLAKAVHRNTDVIWVPTEKLKKLEQTSPAPFDLMPFMEGTGGGSCEPKITGSLRLIIEDVVAAGRQSDLQHLGNVTVDSTLLALSQRGLVSFVKGPDDK